MSQRKQKLLQRYWAGTCSQQELRELFGYLRDDDTLGGYNQAIEDHWNQISSRKALLSEESSELFQRISDRSIRRKLPYWRVAATVAGVLCSLTLFYYLWSDRLVIHSTDYGQTLSVTLPDKSTVTLNSNSTIRYNDDWEAAESREVFLSGEAYFAVQHAPDDQPFTVYTDNLAVKVLGTEFNVQHRRGTTRVTLSSGKVKLNTPEEEGIQVDDIIMLPGEQATLTSEDFHVTTVETKNITAWKENKLIYDNVPLPEVVRTIEDLYGRPIIIEDDSLRTLKLSGTLPHNDMNTLLMVLREALSIQITEVGDEIRLSKTR